MKKIISAVIAAAMALSAAASVAAADDTPKVYVDDTLIKFGDQQPVIVEDRTLVPARGVFEAMNADVDWNEETQTVRIDSEDNITRILLTIDDATMRVLHFTSVFHADETPVTLDVAPQIMNDRTMIPLRAISEAMDCKVDWDEVSSTVDIQTEDYAPAVIPEDPADNAAYDGTAMYLTTDSEGVSAGDTVDIYVNVAAIPEALSLYGLTALISYNTEDFEFTEASLYADGEEASADIYAANPNYLDNAAKALLSTITSPLPSEGAVAKFTFKSLTGKGGEFALVRSYDTKRGYDNSLTTKDGDNNIIGLGEEIIINTTPVKVAGK